MEGSFCGPSHEDIHFTKSDLEEVGHRFCQGLLIYYSESIDASIADSQAD